MTSAPAENPARRRRFLALLARLLVGGLFMVSAVGKIADPPRFAKEVRDYRMLPVEATNVVAYTLPWLELFAGLLLLTTLWRREARWIITSLLVVFTFAKSWTYLHGIDIAGCGCSGGLKILDYIYDTPQGILTNIVLLALLEVDRRVQRRARRAASLSGSLAEHALGSTPDST